MWPLNINNARGESDEVLMHVLEELQYKHFDEDEGRVYSRKDPLDRVLKLFAALRRFRLISAVSLEYDAV